MLYWNEKQLSTAPLKMPWVVIWCSIEMRNSVSCWQWCRTEVVIWCSIEMRNSDKSITGQRLMLWFDALLKWETVTTTPSGETECCDLMLYWNEKQWRERQRLRISSCDLMLYWNEKQFEARTRSAATCCDLMLYWNEKQWNESMSDIDLCCDLMLYWNEKQYFLKRWYLFFVVIWCSIEMRNSSRLWS